MVKEIPSLGTFHALQSASTLSNGLVLYMGLFVLPNYRTLWMRIMKFQYALLRYKENIEV